MVLYGKPGVDVAKARQLGIDRRPGPRSSYAPYSLGLRQFVHSFRLGRFVLDRRDLA